MGRQREKQLNKILDVEADHSVIRVTERSEEASLQTKLVEVMEFQLSYFES